jgi:hypothetical protein
MIGPQISPVASKMQTLRTPAVISYNITNQRRTLMYTKLLLVTFLSAVP